MTLRPSGRHRAPSRLSTTSLSRSAAVAATSTGLLAGSAAAAGANPTSPQEPVTGVAAADTLVRAVETVAAAERPAVAAAAPKASKDGDDAARFGTSGFTAVQVVPTTPAAEPAQDAVETLEQRTTTAASRTEERAAAPQPVAEPEPVQAEPEPVQQAAPAAPAPTGGVLSVAAAYTGIPYQWGGTTPAGFDCSGYSQFVFAQVGISLPRTAAQQQAFATPVSNPQPGDLVFYGYPAYHMGIYAGNGMMYDSPKPGAYSSLRPIFAGVSGYGRVG